MQRARLAPAIWGNYRLRRFSLSEFQKLDELNFFTEDQRVELLDGLLMEMNPDTPLHASCVDDLLELFHTVVGKEATIRGHSPVTLAGRFSQPRPNVTLAIRQPGVYRARHINE